MPCNLCNGSGETMFPEMHKYSQKMRMVSSPCMCLASKLVSRENKLLQYLGEVYLPLDRIDPQLVFTPGDLSISPNFTIIGDYDTFALNVKSIIMKTRFAHPKPRILFSRSIDIIQDYHVPQDDGESPHLSALSVFDLVVVVFGTTEKNKALAPCMFQMISTRIDEKKPTWVYFPKLKLTLSSCEQEISADLEKIMGDEERNFKNIKIGSEEKEIKKEIKKQSKCDATDFTPTSGPSVKVIKDPGASGFDVGFSNRKKK